MSEYAVGLNEKQKARYIYGLLERQFRRVFAVAKQERGITGERFLQLLETRLDSVIYHLGLTKTGRRRANSSITAMFVSMATSRYPQFQREDRRRKLR